jgi:hypothetical protein
VNIQREILKMIFSLTSPGYFINEAIKSTHGVQKRDVFCVYGFIFGCRQQYQEKYIINQYENVEFSQGG